MTPLILVQTGTFASTSAMPCYQIYKHRDNSAYSPLGASPEEDAAELAVLRELLRRLTAPVNDPVVLGEALRRLAALRKGAFDETRWLVAAGRAVVEGKSTWRGWSIEYVDSAPSEARWFVETSALGLTSAQIREWAQKVPQNGSLSS